MHARSKKWVTLASPILGLLLVELFVRVFVPAPAPIPEDDGVLFRISLLPGLTYENRPGAERRTLYRLHPSDPPRVIEQRINSQGFRGQEVSPDKPRGSFRIVCLGDSHTFGTGVEEHETWPSQLQSRFDQSHRLGDRVEIMNCGVSTYDTKRELILMRERILGYEPDLVLLQYHVNDVSPRNSVGWKQPPAGKLFRWSDPNNDGWPASIRSVSKLADVAFDRVHRYLSVRDESGLSMEHYSTEHPGWIAVTGALLEMRDLLTDHGIEFGLVLFPYLLRVDGEFSSHRAYQQVQGFASANGIACLNPESAFDGIDDALLRVHPHDFHANRQAYGLFAKAIHDWMNESDQP